MILASAHERLSCAGSFRYLRSESRTKKLYRYRIGTGRKTKMKKGKK